jgi:hypothetical protein
VVDESAPVGVGSRRARNRPATAENDGARGGAGVAAGFRRRVAAVGRRLDGVTAPRAQRVVLLAGSAALAVQVYFLVTVPPATGYEPSVVTPYPIAHWAAFLVTLAAVVLVSVGAAVRDTGYWRYAFGLLAGAYGIYLSLPIARGYALYGRGSSDQLFHLALVDDLVATGRPPGVFYPHLHFLAAELVGFGIPLGGVQHLVAYAMTMLFVAGVVVFVRTLLDDPRGYPLGLAVATPLLLGEFHGQFHPAVLSFALVPILGAALERVRQTDSRRHALAAATFLFALVFLHPVTTVMAAVLVGSTALTGPLYRRVTGRGVRRLRLTVALAVVPVAFVWYAGFERTQNALVRVLAATSVAPVGRQVDIVSGAELSTLEILRRFVELYGAQFVYFLLAGVCVLAVAWWLLRGRPVPYADAYSAVQYGVGGALAATFMLVYLIAFNPIRVSRYLIVGSILVVAVVYGRRLLAGSPQPDSATVRRGLVPPVTVEDPAPTLGPRPRPRGRPSGSGSGSGSVSTDGGGARAHTSAAGGHARTGRGVVSARRGPAALFLVALVVAAAGLGAFTAYQPNKHLTYGEEAGTAFTLQYGDGTTVRGHALTLKHQLYVLGDRGEEFPRPVFGTTERHAIQRGLVEPGDTALDTYGPTYLATSSYDLGWHTAAYYTPAQQAARVVYTEADLARLAADPTADRVYANDAYELWRVDAPA